MSRRASSRYTGGVSFLAALFLLAAAPASAVPAGTQALSADHEERWIPFEFTPGNQIRFVMSLEGRPVSAILDTGVSYSVVARRYAEAQHLRVRGQAKADVIGGSVPVGWVATRTLAIGGLRRDGGGLAVADLPATATGSATAVDLLVGRDLTADYALDIDYAQRRFRFLRSGRTPFAGTSSQLTIAPDRLVYVSSVVLGGAELRPMVVDTGDGSAVTLGTAAWNTARMPSRTTTTTVSFGLAGPVVSEVAIVPQMVVGKTVARNVEVRVEPSGGFSDKIGVAGRIGSGFLQNYRVLLDPAAGQMLLLPGPDADKPPLRSTSGLLLGIARDRLKVLHVMRGGPAAVAGWRVGDLICRIDGEAITPAYPTSALARWSAGTPGRTVTLRLCNGTERRLTLANFY
ncbi:aspartyl protease family protein [uncultured Sphingomonas sp.]|uniref:aspartyl protease family protein n=1 Tax=uncultured Sphingomonas sp. TaxID=158754 RepID=UPI002613F700|nr:aspartyl protease family protein [uncultured Sphingomonas sp.]